MSSPLGLKRKRAQDANRRLTKPFISPMRTNKPSPAALPPAAAQAYTYTPSSLAHTVQHAYPPPAKSTAMVPKPISRKSSAINISRNSSTLTATPIRKPAGSLLSSKKANASPAELAAQKSISSIEAQIRRTKTELDTLKQAKLITSTSTDADLEQLTDKWRLASQAIAEDLFGSVKERVCRMGGVAAWREMEKKKHDRAHGIGEFAREDDVPEVNDDDCEFDDEGEELPEDEQEYRKKMKRQAEREMADAADTGEDMHVESGDSKGKEKLWEEDGSKEDDSFTMDMMLRSLNIDLSLIGYDKTEQRWVL